jgi:tRNA dimethylallyltransferase
MTVSGEHESGPAIPVLVVCGPTGSGKSGLAISLARELNAEIISADSRQVYRQLKIGTARLEPGDWQGVAHHLMGAVDLGERFTAYDFATRASNLVEDISCRCKRVIVCGGTGLYIRALIDGIIELPDDDPMFRNELMDLAASKGPNHVHQMLVEVDPEEAGKIHPHNMIRVIRALELYQLTGRRKSELSDRTFPFCQRMKSRYLILNPPRDRLYEIIEKRVDDMIISGLEAEVRQLYESPLKEELRRAKIVGYTELIDYMDGRSSLAEAINLIKQNTRRYAKRQYTWFHGIKEGRLLEFFGHEVFQTSLNMVKGFWD